MTQDAPDTIPVMPAEAATELGYDDALPEGSALVLLLAAVVLILATLGVVHLVALLSN